MSSKWSECRRGLQPLLLSLLLAAPALALAQSRPGGGGGPGPNHAGPPGGWQAHPGYRPGYPGYRHGRPGYPGWRPGYPGWHGGYWGPRVGLYWGPGYWGPAYWGPGFWGGWPYATVGYGVYSWNYPTIVSSSTPLVIASPAVQPSQSFIQQDAAEAPAASRGYWYYCRQPAGYFPYVKDCNQDWLKVVPQVPGEEPTAPRLAP